MKLRPYTDALDSLHRCLAFGRDDAWGQWFASEEYRVIRELNRYRHAFIVPHTILEVVDDDQHWDRGPIQELRDWLADHPGAELNLTFEDPMIGFHDARAAFAFKLRFG